MKTIINGVLYDTETAMEVCEVSFRDEDRTVNYYETLYKKRNNDYFLVRDMCGHEGCEELYEYVLTHRVEPLTIDKTKRWLKRYNFIGIYELEFGESPRKLSHK